MAASPDAEQVRRDQSAHIATHHDSYQFSELELRLSSWPRIDAHPLVAVPLSSRSLAG